MKRFKATYKGETVMVLKILVPVVTGDYPDVVFVDSHGILRIEVMLEKAFSECDMEMRSE